MPWRNAPMMSRGVFFPMPWHWNDGRFVAASFTSQGVKLDERPVAVTENPDSVCGPMWRELDRVDPVTGGTVSAAA